MNIDKLLPKLSLNILKFQILLGPHQLINLRQSDVKYWQLNGVLNNLLRDLYFK